MKPLICGILALTIATGMPALAHDPASPNASHVIEAITHGSLVLSGAFARATLPNAPVAGGYVTIANNGGTEDRLVAASSPVAGEVQIHEMAVTNDVMTMRELPDGLTISAGSTVVLEPGGLHLMLMQLREPLVEGETVPVTLVFEQAGAIEIELAIAAAGARSMPHGDHSERGDAATDHHGAAAHHSHSGQFDQASAATDEEAIAGLLKSIFETSDSPLDIRPVVVEGEFAIAGWAQGETGGRALLRKTADRGWAVHLCAGDGLKQATNLVQIGIPEADAQVLEDRLAEAEAALEPDHVELFSLFDGTVIVEEDLFGER